MADKELMQEALKWQEHIKVLANGHADDELYQTRLEVFNWLLDQAEKAEKYREAINNINEKAMLFGTSDEVYDAIQDAIKVLEETK